MYSALPHADTPRGWAQRSEKRRLAEVRYNFDRTGFTIVDHRDIPGRNIVALIDEDQPSLATTCVRYVAEPIVLLADSDRTRLAAAEVAVTYRETTPNFDPDVPTCRSS
jgi:xanthine dehydrogenase molybdopterin-binding subunit B